jgi:beta-lactamase regulating signal transducer with metallopeptidase domain
MLDAISIDNCRLLIQTLGHSLWQASVVAVLCWLVLRSLPARKAGTRYAVTCGGLLVVILATLMTAAVSPFVAASTDIDAVTPSRPGVSNGNSAQSLIDQDKVTTSPLNDRHAQAEFVPPDHSATSPAVEAAVTGLKVDDRRSAVTTSEVTKQSQFAWPALAAAVWVFGVLGMMFRLARIVVALRKLEPCRTLADDTMLSQVRDVILDLSRRMNLRWPVSLVVSDKVSGPGIVGTFWPTLLMPPAMLTGVPVEQLRIVIAHELAHAKRFDFLVNLIQLLVESFLFFNPAVWWLSRQIRIEREACCDAAAVAATGSAVPVARTLLDIVDRLTESLGTGPASEFAMAAGVQSFVGDEPPESTTPLFDRVRRIVTPDQRPHIRVPWYTLLGVITAYGLVGFGLFEGAGVTAQIVQQALSPKERVEKIEQLVAAKGELARREGVAPTTGSNRSKPGEAFPEAVLVTGTVRTADGGPLPKGLTVFGTLSGDSYSGAEQFGTLDEATNEFRFSGQTRGQTNVRGDTALVSLNIGLPRDSEAAKLYAPAAAGPFEVRSGQKIENIDIVLPVGFPGQFRVLNSDGEPISNAFVSGKFVSVTGQSSANLNPSFTRTDADGRTTIPLSTADLSWRAVIRAAGYQKSQFDLRLQKDQPVEVVLKRATPVAIVVTSSVDGRPVAGVRAFVNSEHFTRDGHSFGMLNPSPQQSDPQEYEANSAPLHAYGPSDEDGRLVLDSLADGTRYELLFLTPGYGEVEMTDINVSQPERTLQIAPALSVAGRIIGDLSGLQRDAKTKQRSFQYRPNNRGWFRRVNVEERDGAGHFRLEGLSIGPLTFSLPDRRIQKKLTESIHDLVIDLSQPPEPRPVPAPRVVKLPEPQGVQRRVILKLVGAAVSAPVTGKFRAGYLTRQQPGSYSSAELDIVDSRVEFDVEVPTQIHWTGRSFTGYSVVGRSAIEVGAGDEPFQLDVPLLAGGAVRGVVRLEDGTLARQFKIDLRPVDRKSTYKGADDRVDIQDAPGEFLLTGVPFDAEFQLLISDERPGSVAAIVSEPFSLSTVEPISDLKFQFEEGRAHTLQLLDEQGLPAIGVHVSGWFSPGLGFSRSTGWGVNNDGQVVFQHVADSIPGETTFQVEAAGPFRGQKLKLDWANLPEQLTLKRGVAASGQLVDDATGRGLAAARFFLFPTRGNPTDKRAEFQDAVWGTTDDEGLFSFACLEPVSYQLNLHGAVPPRIPFRKNNRGILEPDYSGIKDGKFPEWFVRGGEAEPVTIKVQLLPQSRLKLSPASNEEN